MLFFRFASPHMFEDDDGLHLLITKAICLRFQTSRTPGGPPWTGQLWGSSIIWGWKQGQGGTAEPAHGQSSLYMERRNIRSYGNVQCWAGTFVCPGFTLWAWYPVLQTGLSRSLDLLLAWQVAFCTQLSPALR